MKREEIYKELLMTYEELQGYLIQKYGGAVCDYFATQECRSKSKKISRTKEGLYCHHMDEDKGGNLANPAQAKMQPFEWQRKERLVYCNILEHLILHIKIAIKRQKDFLEKPYDMIHFFSTGGIFVLCEDINEMFVNNGTSVEWIKRCYEEIRENYEDYIIVIKALLTYIDKNYIGEKNKDAFLIAGGIVHFSDCDCEILEVDKKNDTILLKTSTGDKKRFRILDLMNMFNYVDYIERITRMMASNFCGFCETIYEDIITCDKENEITSYVTAFKVDYSGYGYSQYADIKLGDMYGAKNADMYISNALPMYCAMSYELKGKSVKFWSGSEIPMDALDSFFIVRIETMFNVKKDVEPFVRYRKVDLLRKSTISGIDINQTAKGRGWTVLSTSDVYDKSTDAYYSKYYDENGELVDATVILTLGKNDYLLFKERYDITYLKILDGCYFY